MGIYAARRVLIGKETNAGTAVVPAAILRMPGTWLDDQRTVIRAPDALAHFMPVPRHYTPRLFAALPAQGDATFEQLGYPLNAWLEGVAGVKDGAGSGYVYTRTFPAAAAKTRYAYTLQAGDDQQAWEMAYGSVDQFKLSWKAPGTGGGEDGAWHYEAGWIGRQATKCAFATTPTLPTVETILAPLIYSRVGGLDLLAQVTNTLRSVELGNAKNVPVWTGDGFQYFTRVDQNWESRTNNAPLLTLLFEFNGDGEGEFDKWVAGTTQHFQIKAVGSALATPGTTYTYKTLTLNFYGTIVANPTFSDQDGNDLIAFVVQMGSVDSDGAGTMLTGNIILVNELSALP